jgi:hypothetical protein
MSRDIISGEFGNHESAGNATIGNVIGQFGCLERDAGRREMLVDLSIWVVGGWKICYTGKNKIKPLGMVRGKPGPGGCTRTPAVVFGCGDAAWSRRRFFGWSGMYRNEELKGDLMGTVDIPTFDAFMNPVIQALKELGGSGTIEEINSKVAEIANLSDQQLEVPHNPDKGGRGQEPTSKSTVYLKIPAVGCGH